MCISPFWEQHFVISLGSLCRVESNAQIKPQLLDTLHVSQGISRVRSLCALLCAAHNSAFLPFSFIVHHCCGTISHLFGQSNFCDLIASAYRQLSISHGPISPFPVPSCPSFVCVSASLVAFQFAGAPIDIPGLLICTTTCIVLISIPVLLVYGAH